MTLSKDEILAAITARKADVSVIDVPEWGGSIAVRRMSAGDFERSGLDTKAQGAMSKVVAFCLVNDEGDRLFSDDDAKALEDIDIETMTRVFAEVMRVNGLMSDDVEEAVQAFVTARPDDSSTD